MTDDEFLRAFERCEIPGSQFHHKEHIRLAWICAGKFGAEAADHVAESIRRYASFLGVSDKYHHTMTIAWVRMVACGRAAASFDDFLEANPQLFDKQHINRHYSAELLKSSEARARFVPPDLVPFEA